VPGIDGLHRMTAVLLAEAAPRDARVFVLGAGGGLELVALADAHLHWTFVGIDPSVEMLKLAERNLGPRMERVRLVQGYVHDAPDEAFDAATCLLTLHFLDATERRKTASAVRSRLKPGAPFVVAHSSFPQNSQRARWLSRYAAYAVASGVPTEDADRGRAAVDANLHLLSPERDEDILREAGFADVNLFFAAFTWRGWVAYA
jgi:tRNA (cmo5U34)-methyltransferase